MIEHLVSTKTKQHIVGGLLFSSAVFLGALSATVLTMQLAPIEDEKKNEYVGEYEDDY
jgi:hypothetical protein